MQQGNKWRRKPQTARKGLQISDNTMQYLTYGGLDASIPTQEYLADYNSGKRIRDARSPVQWYDRVPKTSGAADAPVDYVKMANQYATDMAQEQAFKKNIVSQIIKEGGGALWDKITSGKYTAQDVQNLRQYMYKPGSDYSDAQEKFIQIGRAHV